MAQKKADEKAVAVAEKAGKLMMDGNQPRADPLKSHPNKAPINTTGTRVDIGGVTGDSRGILTKPCHTDYQGLQGTKNKLTAQKEHNDPGPRIKKVTIT